MDPQATLNLAADAIADGDLADAAQALSDYTTWRNDGGFEPPDGDARAERLFQALMIRHGQKAHARLSHRRTRP